jgi:hypothetical protein
VGLNEVMATVNNARPHDKGTASYALNLLEPFTVVAVASAPATIDTMGTTEVTGVAGGIQMGTRLFARVLDRFENTLSNKEITWADGAVGGRFVDVTANVPAGTDLTDGKPMTFNDSDPRQKVTVTQRTGPLLPVQTSYIPPYSKDGLCLDVSATSGALKAVIHIEGPPQPSFYLAASKDHAHLGWSGITNTYYSTPISAVVYALTDGVWAPIANGMPGFQSVEVRAYTSTDGANPRSVMQSTSSGELGFGVDQAVRIRPQYLADGGGAQTTWVTATAVSDKGDIVCCDNSWASPATADKVRVRFSRFDSALAVSDLPNPDTSKPDRNVARTTDQYLRVRVDNPSDEPVYIRVAQPAAPILYTKSFVGFAGNTFGIGGPFPLPPGGSDLLVPVIHEGGYTDTDGRWVRCGNGAAICPPDVRATVPAPGMASFEVWAPFKRADSTSTPEPLDSTPGTGSVAHTLPLVPDAKPFGIPVVKFVGGYQCTYSILDRVLSCVNPANAADAFRTLHDETYSGHWTAAASGGTCINNPCAQCWVSGNYGGPISEGSYLIEPGYLDPDRQFMSYKLRRVNSLCGGDLLASPDARVTKTIVSINDAFMIHYGKNAPGSPLGGDFSEGCIVVDSNTDRDHINALGGGTLTVIAADPENASFDRNRCPATYGYGWTRSPATSSDPCAGLTDGTLTTR